MTIRTERFALRLEALAGDKPTKGAQLAAAVSRNTVTEIGRAGFGREITGLGPASADFVPAFMEELAVYRKGTRLTDDEVRDLANVAKWGINPGEYGDPPGDALTRIHSEILDLESALLADPDQVLTAKITECSEAEDLGGLSAWWSVVRDGHKELAAGIATFQRLALKEALELPRWRDLPWSDEMHDFLYTPRPEFAFSYFDWRERVGGIALMLPHLMAAADRLLPDPWWSTASSSIAQDGASAFRDPQGDYIALLRLIAEWRMVGERPAREGFASDDDPKDQERIVYDDELASRAAPGVHQKRSGILREIKEVLEADSDPRLWEIYRRAEWLGEPGKDVAADMNIDPSRVSRLRKKAKAILREAPRLERIFRMLPD